MITGFCSTSSRAAFNKCLYLARLTIGSAEHSSEEQGCGAFRSHLRSGSCITTTEYHIPSQTGRIYVLGLYYLKTELNHHGSGNINPKLWKVKL